MRYEKNSATRTLLFIGMLGLLTVLFTPTINAEPLKPIPGEFSVIYQGADPQTGELILEGPKTGPLPGHLSIRATLTRQTGTALHFSARWTLITPWGETITGENTAVLSTASLHFREHGLIVEATGSLTERVGNFIVIHGEFSDLSFMPGVMEVTGSVMIVPSQAKM